MQRLLEFLFQNPILLFILIAWVAGVVGNAVKATKRARERAEQMRRMPSAEPRPAAQPVATERQASPSAEEVAAEMRRILGMEPVPEARRPREPQRRPRPVVEPDVGTAPPPARPGRRDVVEQERPPAEVVPTTQNRKLDIHVDPHVGDRIQNRRVVGGGRIGLREKGSQFGTLGGRVHEVHRQRQKAVRFALDDLTKAFVMSEILGPPLAMRDPFRRLPG